jgi:hypothetical protein
MSRHKRPKHDETPEHEPQAKSKFSHLGAIEVLPALEEKSIDSPDSQFAHLGAYQVRAGGAE